MKSVDAINRERVESQRPTSPLNTEADTIPSDSIPNIRVGQESIENTVKTVPGPLRPESRNRKKSFRPYYEIIDLGRVTQTATVSRTEMEEQVHEDGTNRIPMIRTPIGQSTPDPIVKSDQHELIASTPEFYNETCSEVR